MIAPLLLVLLAGSISGAELPLGHPEFVPSPARPVGWRGDGTGVWPGAKPVTRWSETENVLWKIAMPSHSSSAPILVGRKLFTLREPNFLLCVDADTGKVLWERENDPLEIRGVDAATVAKAKRLAELAKMSQFLILSLRPDDRSGEEQLLAQKAAFAKADDMLLGLIKEAASLEPKLAELHTKAAHAAAIRDSNYRESISTFKQLYGGIGDYVNKTYNFHGDNTWPGYIDYTFPTPASDGRYVYAAMGQNQVVCYDLDGKRIWAQSPGLSRDTDGKRPQSADRATYTQSPLLVNGVLAVQAGFLIRGFDAATGKIVWELPYPPQGASYSCGTARALKVGNEHVIVTVHGWVIRVRDGKKVGDLGHGNMGSESGGASMVSDEEGCVYFLKQNKSIVKVKLRAQPDGTISGETVFAHNVKTFGGPTPIVYGGLLYVCGNGIDVYDATTGELLKRVPAKVNKPSPTVAGDRLIATSDKGEFTILSLGRDAKGLGTAKLAWSKPRNPWFEKQWPEIYQAIEQSGRKFDNTISRQFSFSHPCYAGNRLYIRSVSHLYCIGAK